MAVYFYVDWCPYCAELDKKILASPEVRQYLDQILYVSINAEKGQKEKALFARLGGTGYPYFLVVSKGLDQAQKIRAHSRENNRWVLLSPAGFVEACKKAEVGRCQDCGS